MTTPSPAIVLIERDEITLEIYQRALSSCFNVFCFTELTGVPETLARQDIQAIVIEPEICSGLEWEWMDILQKMLSGRDIPIIVCSTRDASRRTIDRRIALYLTKPVLPRTLREKILGVIASKKMKGVSI